MREVGVSVREDGGAFRVRLERREMRRVAARLALSSHCSDFWLARTWCGSRKCLGVVWNGSRCAALTRLVICLAPAELGFCRHFDQSAVSGRHVSLGAEQCLSAAHAARIALVFQPAVGRRLSLARF